MAISIRHIATSQSSGLFATGEVDRTVTLWSLEEQREVMTLDTVLDFGGRRLAVVGGDDPLLLAGVYSVNGLAAYSIRDAGAMVWRRKDLKKVQHIQVDERTGRCAVGLEGKPLHVLDVRTGETPDILRGVRQAWFGPEHGQMVVEGAFGLAQVQRREDGKARERSLLCRTETLDVATGNGHLAGCIASEHEFHWADNGEPLNTVYAAQATLRCWDRIGRMLWSEPAPNGSHFLRVAWCGRDRSWYAIQYAFERGGPYILKAFDEAGDLLLAQPVGVLAEAEFTGDGEFLVASSGDVLALPSLEIAWHFTDT